MFYFRIRRLVACFILQMPFLNDRNGRCESVMAISDAVATADSPASFGDVAAYI